MVVAQPTSVITPTTDVEVSVSNQPVGFFVVSHASRADVRAQTLEHLKAQGIQPHVQIQTDPPESWRMRRNTRDALAEHLPFDRPLVMLEDDVRLHKEWRTLLALLVEADHPTVCCTLETQNVPQPWNQMLGETRIAVEPAIVPMEKPLVFRGTQCVYFPVWYLWHMWGDPRLHDDDPMGMSFDGFLNVRMRDGPHAVRLNVLIPDMAEHLAPVSVRRGRPGTKSRMHKWTLK